MESNICNVYLDIYTLDSQHGVATWTSTWDSHIHAIILQLDSSDRYLHQLPALEAESVSYIANLGHPQVALHTHLASDLTTLQHQIDKMSNSILLQVQHRHRQPRKTHHKMLMEHLQENIENNDINLICLEAVEHINSQRALHRQDTSASSSSTPTKGVATTKSTTSSSTTTTTDTLPSASAPTLSTSSRSASSSSTFPCHDSGESLTTTSWTASSSISTREHLERQKDRVEQQQDDIVIDINNKATENKHHDQSKDYILRGFYILEDHFWIDVQQISDQHRLKQVLGEHPRIRQSDNHPNYYYSINSKYRWDSDINCMCTQSSS